MHRPSTDKRRLYCLVLLLLGGAWCIPSGCKKESKNPNDIVVYIVRHAEKESGGQNLLTPAGQQRAERLADSLERSGISAIYVSDPQRVQQTAAPTARRLGLTPKVMPVGSDTKAYAQAVAGDIRANQSGGRVLVVGQVNTIPLIMQNLGITSAPTITESDYDNFFIVVLRSDGEATLTKVTYGQGTPAGSPG